ncbi:unnamed protein product [Soboliphyme baturini]|uniref:Uncharacterized protein n=1 Tax=Soboliphyme baturini TaxID=241478 RepID=A0A183IBY2_9BILA|nr:unnamed protein product [Soboliphyme baturini]
MPTNLTAVCTRGSLIRSSGSQEVSASPAIVFTAKQYLVFYEIYVNVVKRGFESGRLKLTHSQLAAFHIWVICLSRDLVPPLSRSPSLFLPIVGACLQSWRQYVAVFSSQQLFFGAARAVSVLKFEEAQASMTHLSAGRSKLFIDGHLMSTLMVVSLL